jgi:hypothetical protein
MTAASDPSFDTAWPDRLWPYAVNIAGVGLFIGSLVALVIDAVEVSPGAVFLVCCGLTWVVITLDHVVSVTVAADGGLVVRLLYWTRAYPSGVEWKWRKSRGGVIAGYLQVRPCGARIYRPYMVAARFPSAAFAAVRAGHPGDSARC